MGRRGGGRGGERGGGGGGGRGFRTMGGICGGTCLLIILNVCKVVLSEGKLILVGEFICRFLWCLKFRKIFSSVPSKKKKPYVRKKRPVTKLHIVKLLVCFLTHKVSSAMIIILKL